MTENESNYTPIECGLHSQYELAIMHKTESILEWVNSNNALQREIVLPVDILTRDKQEFLKVMTQKNEIFEIRLDKIQYIRPA